MSTVRRLGAMFVSVSLLVGGLTLATAGAAHGDTGCPTPVAPAVGAPGLIATPAEFQGLQATPALWNEDWMLTVDIDMAGCTWTDRIGDNSRGIFSGTFDGDGHTISGLTIDVDDSYVGLFGYVEGSSVGNEVVIKDLTFTGDVRGDSYVGGLIGNLENLGQVMNVHTTGDVTSAYDVAGGLIGYIRGYDENLVEDSSATGAVTTLNGPTAGGLIGFAGHATVRDSYATGNATATDEAYAGGLIAYAEESTVERSFSTGDVRANAEAAGFIGYIAFTDVSDSYSLGSVTYSETGYAGVAGFIGYAYRSSVTDSYSVGAIVGDLNATYTGGFAASLDGPNPVTSSFWDIDTSGYLTSAAGEGKTTAEMTSLDTFSAWSIGQGFDPASTWGICPAVNSGYPFLTAFHSTDPCTGGGAAGRRTTTRPPAYQALPLPDSGLCADVDDTGVDYGTGISGGWSRSWQPWVRTPGSDQPTGGWACVRVLEYTLSTDSWRVQGAT